MSTVWHSLKRLLLPKLQCILLNLYKMTYFSVKPRQRFMLPADTLNHLCHICSYPSPEEDRKYVPPEGGTRSQGNRWWRGKEREWIHLFYFFDVDYIDFVTILLLFCVLVFWPWTSDILSPQPRIKPAPLALEGDVLTTNLPGKSLRFNTVVAV